MSDPQKNGSISVKTLVLFFLLDTSGSMSEDGKITQVNEAFKECFGKSGELTRFAESDQVRTNAEVKVAALKFSDGAEWITRNGPFPIGKFPWNSLEADGGTDMGRAFIELDSKLHRTEFLSDPQGYKVPYYILVTDGYPTDDWKKGLEELRTNQWFTGGKKIVIAVGDDANKDEAFEVLKAFTGHKELVIPIKNYTKLAKLIQVVSMSSIKGGSKPEAMKLAPTNDPNYNPEEEELIEAVKEIKEDDDWV